MRCKYCGNDSGKNDVCYVCDIIQNEAEIEKVPGGHVIRLDRRFITGGNVPVQEARR
jgi:hypothetical protein